MKLGRGAVVVVEPDPVIGHERRGMAVAGDPRFPLVCVVPVTGTPGEGLLYPAAFALIDQLRSIDKRRIRRVFGELAPREVAAVDEGLTVFLGIAAR